MLERMRSTRDPSISPSSVISVRLRLVIDRRTPEGSTTAQTLASWKLSGSAMALAAATLVPLRKLGVRPLAARLDLADSLHGLPLDACRLARSDRHRGEQVEVLEDGGAENSPPHITHDLIMLNERGHYIQGGGGGHPSLLPVLDGAAGRSARIGKLLGAPSELGADRLDAWCVVHKRPVIREDDGLPVGRRAVVGRHSHGLVLGEGEAASEVDKVVADAVNLDDRNGLAIAGLGLAEVFLDGVHGWLAIGADCSGVAGKAVADGGRGLGCSGHFLFWLVRLKNKLVGLSIAISINLSDLQESVDVAGLKSLAAIELAGLNQHDLSADFLGGHICVVSVDDQAEGFAIALKLRSHSHLKHVESLFRFHDFGGDEVLSFDELHFFACLVRGLIASTPASYAQERNESTSFYALERIYFHGPKKGILPHNA